MALVSVGNWESGIGACGFYDTPSRGFCLYSYPDTGVGELGFCAQFCDIDDDCGGFEDPANNSFCNLDWQQSFGRGLCDFQYGTGE